MKLLFIPLLMLWFNCSGQSVYRVDSLLKEKQMSRFYLLRDTVTGETMVKRMDYRGAGRKRSFLGRYYFVSYVNEKRFFKLLK